MIFHIFFNLYIFLGVWRFSTLIYKVKFRFLYLKCYLEFCSVVCCIICMLELVWKIIFLEILVCINKWGLIFKWLALKTRARFIVRATTWSEAKTCWFQCTGCKHKANVKHPHSLPDFTCVSMPHKRTPSCLRLIVIWILCAGSVIGLATVCLPS